jgi:ABC-type nitrate/sulfonate/bicarbonate transport system substrate-binding protein
VSTMRTALLAIVTFLSLAGGWLRMSFAQDVKRLRYGVSPATAHLPIWAAKEGGIFSKYGLDVEVILMRGGPLSTMAIVSGQMQLSSAGAESVVAARIEGADLVLLACPINADPVYLIARPEIKNPAELKNKTSAVTRLGSTTHFYLWAALKQIGIDADKEIRILQLGTSSEIAVALETGRIAVAALTVRNAIRFLEKGWPLLVDLSKTNFVYPPSCVTSSRAFLGEQSGTVERFLKAYVEAIRRLKQDRVFAERVYAKSYRETDLNIIKKTVEVYADLFKPVPYVPDQGIDVVVKQLAQQRPLPKGFVSRAEQFRDNGPLEKLVKESWIDRLYR